MTLDKKTYIHFAIMFLLTIVISLCPPFGQITSYGMKALGVFVGVLYGWIFIDLLWPSLFGFAALAIANITPIGAALATGIGNFNLLMVLIVLLFAGALEESGFADWVGVSLLRIKFFQKSPWSLIAGTLIVSYILGLLGASMAAILLLWATFTRIADLCNIPRKDPLISFLIFSAVTVSTIAGCVLPFQAYAIVYLGFLDQAAPLNIPYNQFILFAGVVSILTTIVLFLLAKFVFKLDASRFALPEELVKEFDQKKINKKQKCALIITIIYFAALLLPGFIPNVPGMKFLSSLNIIGITIIALLVMSFIKIDGEALIQLNKIFTKHVQWPLIMLLAVTFPIADALKSADSGIMVTVNQFILPIVSNMGLIPFMIISMIMLGSLTQVTHNIVLGAMFIPFLVPLCGQLGGNPIIMWFMLYFVLQSAFVTPAASFQSAMIHGNQDMIKKDAYIWGIVFLIAIILILTIVGIPLGNLIF